ncbi:MAG: GTA-gp10 family protein [Alphaproteobacteria bacterium]|nr:GTA-gp10 family protein [Alphaproteobacteria bacterium]
MSVPFNFRHAGKLYRLAPDARLVCAIEDELGALPALAARFKTGAWRMTELLTMMQMFLQSCGQSADFYVLGDEILQSGLAAPLAAVRRFLAPFDDEGQNA